MTNKQKVVRLGNKPKPDNAPQLVPYLSGEEAFFGMAESQRYAATGSRPNGSGVIRTGSAMDIQNCIESLYRKSKLSMDHILVLRHYGIRGLKPDETRPKEYKAAQLWKEAMAVIDTELRDRGIVRNA